MEDKTCESPGSRTNDNSRINEPDIETSCKNESDAGCQYGECTPQQSERYMDNSIFNTISKIVNPATKVSYECNI